MPLFMLYYYLFIYIFLHVIKILLFLFSGKFIHSFFVSRQGNILVDIPLVGVSKYSKPVLEQLCNALFRFILCIYTIYLLFTFNIIQIPKSINKTSITNNWTYKHVIFFERKKSMHLRNPFFFSFSNLVLQNFASYDLEPLDQFGVDADQ